MKNKKISIRIIFPVVMSASIAACIISCILLFSYYFSTYFQKDAIEKIGKQRDFLAQSLETQIENINVLINRIYYQNIKKYDVDSARFAEKMEQQIFLEEKCLYGLALYDIDGESIWHSGTFAEQEDAKEMAWFLQAKENIETISYGRRRLVRPQEDSYVFEISRYVEYIKDGNMRSGILLMEYYTDSVDEILSHYRNQKSAYCYLLDDQKNMLYHPFDKEIASGLYKEKTIESALSCKNYRIEKADGQQWLIEGQQIGYTGWNMVVVNSMDSLVLESHNLHYLAWFILLLIGVILIFLDTLVFHNFTNPIYRLLRTMEKFGKGDYNARAQEEGIGELKNVSIHFNIMADKLQEQMEEIRRNEREKQKMEKKLLQSQINPHFLYNTLDSIIWMAEGKKYEDVVLMTASLARLLRQSISNEDETVLIGQEIQYVKSYLTIQKMRYKDKLEFAINVDPSINSVHIVKLVLQPIVENAIYHGLKYKESKGMLTVNGYQKDGNAVIEIADDGVGMDEETLNRIFEKHKVNYRSNGVGVYNVQRRLCMYYGKEYGLSYKSEKGKGTTVTVVIPIEQEEHHEKA